MIYNDGETLEKFHKKWIEDHVESCRMEFDNERTILKNKRLEAAIRYLKDYDKVDN